MFDFTEGDRVRLNDFHPIFEQYVSNLVEAEVAYIDEHDLSLKNIISEQRRGEKLVNLYEGDESSHDFYPNELIAEDIWTITGLILSNKGTHYTYSDIETLREEEYEKYEHLIGLPILIPATKTHKQQANLLKKLPIL